MQAIKTNQPAPIDGSKCNTNSSLDISYLMYHYLGNYTNYFVLIFRKENTFTLMSSRLASGDLLVRGEIEITRTATKQKFR